MNQDQVIVLLFKIILIADIVAGVGFIAQYSRLASWWRNPIGRTIVTLDILLVLALVPSVLSFFFHFNRLTSHVAAWFDVVMFGLIAPVMIWRIVVWQKIHVSSRAEGEKTPGS